MSTITTPAPATQALNTDLATGIRRLDKQIAELQAERAEKAKVLAYRLPIGKSEVAPGVSVTVSEVNTYDGDLFLSRLRPGQIQRVTTRTLDRGKARENYGTEWEAVKVNKGRKVSVSK